MKAQERLHSWDDESGKRKSKRVH